ncbi:type II toxin-antitoxin system RelE/ParE family toxin [Specibacter sp. NPDC078692]|uniref:type II toxin-antitoxin system RelE family toxin n=1 Tax=Specibacter sp. NPDC078692 TaxID=3155818 RepID=UPI00343A915A
MMSPSGWWPALTVLPSRMQKRLVGEAYGWRVRLGDYRVLCDIFDDVLVVTVVGVGHRRDSYRLSYR